MATEVQSHVGAVCGAEQSAAKRRALDLTVKKHFVSAVDAAVTRYRLQCQTQHEHTGVHLATKQHDMERIYKLCKEALKDTEIVQIPAGQSLEQTVIDIHALSADQRPFYVMDLSVPVRMYEAWKRLIPRVRPHYAVKCNSNPGILATLAACGAGFDCATPNEMDLVLAMGVSPDRIIYANTVKTPAYIRAAHEKGVKRMAFDNEFEIPKMIQQCPDAELVLRLATDDSHSVLAFSSKFGASLSEGKRLVRLCRKHNANLVGCSFHVGSGCEDPKAYDTALNRVKQIFDYAQTQGYNLRVIDLGGGWPGSDFDINVPEPPKSSGEKESSSSSKTTTTQHAGYEGIPPFSVFADHVSKLLDQMFPESGGYELMAEPGRYFATAVTTLACSVIARRPIYNRDITDNDIEMPKEAVKGWKYYLSDGVYGSMNNALTDHVHPTAQILFSKNPDIADTSKWMSCTLFGPTCDSQDTINTDIKLPELFVDDWLYLRMFGAYTQSLVTRFNGFPPPVTHYVMTMPPSFFETKASRK